jgi:hypothetical protein
MGDADAFPGGASWMIFAVTLLDDRLK